MTKAELIDILSRAGLLAWSWQLPDESYETCSLDFVLRNFAAWLDARPFQLVQFREAAGVKIRDRPLWLKEAGDCENLAIGTMAWAQVGNAMKAVANGGGARGGLAYGVLFYNAGPARAGNFFVAGGHAINWFVDHDGNLHFFEPGMGREVELTSEERNAVWFGIAA